jgi:thymidylate synthase (FAD)
VPVTFKTLDELKVELVGYTEMTKHSEVYERESSDFMPVTAARVSHGQEDITGVNVEKDKKLMQYLAEHKHFSPFEHQSATFVIEAPLFVAREWMRHRTQAFNEISMRYTSDPASTYWIPDAWREQAAKNKQSSAGNLKGQDYLNDVYKEAINNSVEAYDALLAVGVARELARSVLPVSMVTRFFATANLRNWAHWFKLRSAPGAQEEIRHYATKLDEILSNVWPNSWSVLKEFGD